MKKSLGFLLAIILLLLGPFLCFAGSVTALPGDVAANPAVGSTVDYAPGWASGSWQANGTNVTEYYTSAHFKPTKKIAEAGETGAATVIIEGLATGMISTALPVLRFR